MIKDFISSKERIESGLTKINDIIKRDSVYLALAMSVFIFYIILITSNIGA